MCTAWRYRSRLWPLRPWRRTGEGADCLADLGPSERPFVAVVIGRIDALGDTLDAGDRLDRAAVLRGNARTDDPCERPVVRLDTHDPSGRHAQVGRAEPATPTRY